MSKKRALKVVLSFVLLAGGLYLVLGEQLAGTSADAVINAQISTLRSPIDGNVAFANAQIGARIGQGELIAAITDPRPDSIRLVDLRRNFVQTQSDLTRLEQLTDALNRSRVSFQTQARDYSEGRIQLLQARLAEAQTVMLSTQSKLRQNQQTLNRLTQLMRTGATTAAELERSQSASSVSDQDVKAAQQRVNYASVELEAAKLGTFLTDSNDVPYSVQRLKEIEARLSDTEIQAQLEKSRLSALKDQIDQEQVRFDRSKNAILTAPASSIIWAFPTGSGEYVRKGQDLIKLVDCSTTVVTASVRESLSNKLKVGDHVQFLLGGTRQIHDGVITRLAGAGALTIYATLAIGPSEEHLKRYDVTLKVPTLSSDPALACAVGRTGRVVFSGRPLDVFRRLLSDTGLF